METHELTGMERQKQSGDLLSKRHMRIKRRAAVLIIHHQKTKKSWPYLVWVGWSEDERKKHA